MPPVSESVETRREDIRLRAEAKRLGWEDRDKDVPAAPIQFKKAGKLLWFCSMGWACADLVSGGAVVGVRYLNHRYYETLQAAFDSEGAS